MSRKDSTARQEKTTKETRVTSARSFYRGIQKKFASVPEETSLLHSKEIACCSLATD